MKKGVDWFWALASVHARCLLWPMITPGKPGRLTPLTSYRGALTTTWNQADAIGSGKAAEPASIVPPPATFAPFMAQALPAAQWLPACPYGRSRVAARAGAAPPAPAGAGVPRLARRARRPGRPRWAARACGARTG